MANEQFRLDLLNKVKSVQRDEEWESIKGLIDDFYINKPKTSLDDWEKYFRKHLSKQNVRQDLEAFFKCAFASVSDLQFIMLRGYTPFFNDGDPCYHRQDASCGAALGDYLHDEIYDQMYDDFGWDGDGSPKDWDDEAWQHFTDCLGHSSEQVDWKKIFDKRKGNFSDHKKVLSILDLLENECERVWGTNFIIWVFPNEDGSVRIEHDDYHPEW